MEIHANSFPGFSATCSHIYKIKNNLIAILEEIIDLSIT